MKELIQMATKQLGLPEEKVRTATGGLLQMVKTASDEKDFSTLLQKVPGTGQLLEGGSSAAEADSGGMLGGLLNTAASAMGGQLGSVTGLAGVMSQSGLDAGQVTALGGMLFTFIKDRIGPDLLGNLLKQSPELSKLLPSD